MCSRDAPTTGSPSLEGRGTGCAKGAHFWGTGCRAVRSFTEPVERGALSLRGADRAEAPDRDLFASGAYFAELVFTVPACGVKVISRRGGASSGTTAKCATGCMFKVTIVPAELLAILQSLKI